MPLPHGLTKFGPQNVLFRDTRAAFKSMAPPLLRGLGMACARAFPRSGRTVPGRSFLFLHQTQRNRSKSPMCTDPSHFGHSPIKRAFGQ